MTDKIYGARGASVAMSAGYSPTPEVADGLGVKRLLRHRARLLKMHWGVSTTSSIDYSMTLKHCVLSLTRIWDHLSHRMPLVQALAAHQPVPWVVRYMMLRCGCVTSTTF